MAPSWTMAILLCFCVASAPAISFDGIGEQQESDVPGTSRQKLLMAHYMPWYFAEPERHAWVGHWTMGKFDPDQKLPNGLPEIASHVHPLIGVYDSNDRDVIEPTHEHGYRYLEIVVAERRREAGGRFPFHPEDLRLPAELLRLRRRYREDTARTARLDEVSRTLIQGDVRAARRLLTNLVESR